MCRSSQQIQHQRNWQNDPGWITQPVCDVESANTKPPSVANVRMTNGIQSMKSVRGLLMRPRDMVSLQS